MSWFTRDKRSRLSVAWEFTAKGTIWRLLPSPEGKIIIEDRDTVRKEVSFTCLDLATGRAWWNDVQHTERWWITIDSVQRGVLFLHEYASPDMPDHKKIIAIDLHSGETIWTNDELKLLFSHETSVYASQDGYEERRFYELDLSTGAMKGEIDARYLSVLRETVAKNSVDQMQFASPFAGPQSDGIHGQSVASATAKAGDVSLVECLDVGRKHVLAYYEDMKGVSAQASLRQHLCVLDGESHRLIFRDILNDQAMVAVPETFFAVGSFVYYIKNKTVLRALNLSEN